VCESLAAHSHVEFHFSDFTVPTGYVTPIEFFVDPEPWRVLVWSTQPYNLGKAGGHLSSARFVTEQYNQKDEQYIPKAFYIEDVELGWIAYTHIDNCVFIHHNQLPGAFKSVLTPTEQSWVHRYMLRMFSQSISAEGTDIFLPGALTYHQYMKKAQVHTATPMSPFSQRVVQSSGFTRIDWGTFASMCPSAANQCILPNYVNTAEINMWHYARQDNSHR
jgi:hypothetical protein